MTECGVAVIFEQGLGVRDLSILPREDSSEVGSGSRMDSNPGAAGLSEEGERWLECGDK
jgi:hypothetical protein